MLVKEIKIAYLPCWIKVPSGQISWTIARCYTQWHACPNTERQTCHANLRSFRFLEYNSNMIFMGEKSSTFWPCKLYLTQRICTLSITYIFVLNLAGKILYYNSLFMVCPYWYKISCTLHKEFDWMSSTLLF